MSGKYALIIGNTEYTDPGLTQLTAPARDVEDFERVLKDPEICAFDSVITLINQPSSTVIAAIDEFYDQKKYDDLLVLYFSGHGIKDEFGSLYLAFKDTIINRLRRTAIKSADISEVMDQSRSRRQVLILDCCNSGAFPEGAKTQLGGTMGFIKAFQGKGRFVLTASNAIQFAYEGGAVIGETQNSLFTHFLVKGLRGEADNNGDGNITVDELYDYAYNEISKITPKQTPTKSATKQEGDLFLRQNMPLKDIKSVPLPPYLTAAIENPIADVRLGAVQSLESLLNGKNLGLARSAREELERIEKEDDSRRVSQAATKVLEPIRQAEKGEEEKKTRDEEEHKPREEAERIARQKAEQEQLARQKAEAERKAKQERLAREKAERDAKAEAERRIKEEKKKEPFQKTSLFKIGTPIGLVGLTLCCLVAGFYTLSSLTTQNLGATPTSLGIARTITPALIASTETAMALTTNTAIARLTSTAIARSTNIAITKATNTAIAIATAQSRDRYVRTLESESLLMFEPKNGILQHNADNYIQVVKSGVSLKNFKAQATFTNPYATSVGEWDYGFLFRDLAGNNQYRLIIISTGRWELYNSTAGADGSMIDAGQLANLDKSPSGSNTITLYCSGDKGMLFVNETFVAELDLSARENFGDVAVGTGFLVDHEIVGYSTQYEDFTVWKLP